MKQPFTVVFCVVLALVLGIGLHVSLAPAPVEAQGPPFVGGDLTFSLEPVGSDNHQTIKNAPGIVHHINSFNTSSVVNFYRLYDAGNGFNGCGSAQNLKWEGAIPASSAGAGFIEDISKGIDFNVGISLCVTAGYGNTNTVSATTSAISLNIAYQ